MTVIKGNKQLQEFRNYWNGERMLKLIECCNGRMRVNWQIGTGKSRNIDQILEAAITSGKYDLIIVFCPTRQILNERDWVIKPPSGVRIANLRRRPRRLCGKMDREWKIFEQNGLGILGRLKLCGQCNARRRCYWPEQYGKSLEGTQVIFATQFHLNRSPIFINQLVHWTGAKRVLGIFDEATALLAGYRRQIKYNQLLRFVKTLKKLNTRRWGRLHERWIYLTSLLLEATIDDLRHPEWIMPPIFANWSLAVQSQGWKNYGEQFRFLPYDLNLFGISPIDSREKSRHQDLIFSALPWLGIDFVIYSATANPDLVKFRIGHDFISPFSDFKFEHPDTKWFNISSRLGAACFFVNNADQIIDFFAGLIVHRIKKGHRPLLISKKRFIQFCAEAITKRLSSLGHPDVHVVAGNWDKIDLTDRNVIPIINYGMVGTNLFEEFSCAYCLNSYYVNEEILNQVLQDLVASDWQIPIKIITSGRPRRRKAQVANAKHQIYDIHNLAQSALQQQEMDTVLQAVGRVRPYTRPREIITFQCAEHPQIHYEKEFANLHEARKYFGIKNRRESRKAQTSDMVRAAKESGLTQAQAAKEIGVSIRTIKRYWKMREGT